MQQHLCIGKVTAVCNNAVSMYVFEKWLFSSLQKVLCVDYLCSIPKHQDTQEKWDEVRCFDAAVLKIVVIPVFHFNISP